MNSRRISFALAILITLCTLLSSQVIFLHGSSNIGASRAQAIVADHSIVDMVRLDLIPDSAIITAKNTLHIAYAHTSHGEQIIEGMTELPAFKEANGGTPGLYGWNEGGTGDALDIDDFFVSGDLGSSDWASRTRGYLDDPANSDVNVVMWAWCGQVSTATEEYIDTYLSTMTALETDYPGVMFVYMTGHTDGTGLTGNLHIRNDQIRAYCAANGKILYDFEDIESYDPNGTYFGDKLVLDSCGYDSNGDGDPYNDGNWAIEWQTSHTEGVDWYDCVSAHSQPLNANQKAYAAWWLWAKLAGWESTIFNEVKYSSPILLAILFGMITLWVFRRRFHHI